MFDNSDKEVLLPPKIRFVNYKFTNGIKLPEIFALPNKTS